MDTAEGRAPRTLRLALAVLVASALALVGFTARAGLSILQDDGDPAGDRAREPGPPLVPHFHASLAISTPDSEAPMTGRIAYRGPGDWRYMLGEREFEPTPGSAAEAPFDWLRADANDPATWAGRSEATEHGFVTTLRARWTCGQPWLEPACRDQATHAVTETITVEVADGVPVRYESRVGEHVIYSVALTDVRLLP